tara:strand:- start:188 stop:547 length:360 start_codon:yes stop_codon:yes gene_type:complete
MNFQLFLYSFFYALANVAGAALIKKEIKLIGNLSSIDDYLKLLFKWRVVLGFIIIFSSALILFKALSIFDFSKIIPLSIGINFLLTVLLGTLLFEEIINFYSLIGMITILIGIVIITMN